MVKCETKKNFPIFLGVHAIIAFTSTSSWGASCLCVHTSSYGNWWLLGEDEHNTYGKSFCHSYISVPKYGG